MRNLKSELLGLHFYDNISQCLPLQCVLQCDQSSNSDEIFLKKFGLQEGFTIRYLFQQIVARTKRLSRLMTLTTLATFLRLLRAYSFAVMDMIQH